MRLRRWWTVVATAAVLVVAGCGSGGDDGGGVASLSGKSANGTTQTTAKAKGPAEAARDFARCMREHGIDFPDPVFEEGGKMTQKVGGPGAGIDPNSQKFQDAMKACAKDAPGGMMFGGPPSGGSQ